MQDISYYTLATPHGAIRYGLTLSARRKTMMIRVTEPAASPAEALAQVRVVAPSSVHQEQIHFFLREKSRWVIEKSKELNERKFLLRQKKFEPGQEFWFLGKKYPLEIIPCFKRLASVQLDEAKWRIEIPAALTSDQSRQAVKKTLIKWYRNQAQELLAGRVLWYARRMKVEPLRITVRTQKRIWGSCHPRKKAIYLNWQIVMAPLSVIDYVVVHELSHLKVPHHSRRFWRTVEKILPDYRQERRWLKEHHHDMMLPTDEN